MARSEKVPVRHGDEESAELFPGRDTDVSFDTACSGAMRMRADRSLNSAQPWASG